MTASDHQYWQRSDFSSGGRYTGRQYYDQGTTEPEDDRVDRVAEPGSAGRTITVLGMIIALAGGAGWLWLILAFVSSVGANHIADHPFSTRVAGIPLGSGGFLAILIGTLLVGA